MNYFNTTRIMLSLFLLFAAGNAMAQDLLEIRTLNTYETPLTAVTAAELATHPLIGVDVKFVAVNITNPLNSGLASLVTASDGRQIPGRIHIFVADTNAVHNGLDGQYMQIVAGTARELFEPLGRGEVIEVTGQLTFFGVTAQFDPSAVTVIGSVQDEEFAHLQPLLEPTVVSIEDINIFNEQNLATANAANYTKYVSRYVKVENATVINRLINNTGRPWMYIGNDQGILYTTDTSLRFRNDRSAAGYADNYNWRRINSETQTYPVEDGPYAPPPPGAKINLSGFIVGNTFDPDNIEADEPAMKITPWDDGVVWVGPNATAERFTPENWPNDLVIVGFPPEFSNFDISTLLPKSNEQVVVSVDITAVGDGVTVSTATIKYTPTGGTEVEANLTNTSGNTYSFTFPVFPDLTTVSFQIFASDSEGLNTSYPVQQFLVLDNQITSIGFIQETTDGMRGPSPLFGKGSLPMDLTATVVSDSTDGFVIIQDSSSPWSGIALANTAATRALVRGDQITITQAEVLRQFDLNYLGNLSFTKLEESNPDFASLFPVLSTNVFGEADRGAPYYGMVVQFNDVTVANRAPDSPSDFGEWAIASDGGFALRVDDRYQYSNVEIRSNFSSQFARNLIVGAEINSLIGAVQYSFGNPKLAIRQLEDIDYVSNLTYPVRTFPLLSPADNANIAVTDAGPIVVEWDSSFDFDGDEVFYLWVLDDAPSEGSPSFDDPLVVLPSDGDGSQPQITIPFGVADTLLARIGMAQNETREFVWTVFVHDGKDTVQVSTYASAAYTGIFRNVSLTKTTTTSSEFSEGPLEFRLSQNYPNPFNPSTRITYSIPSDEQVRLTVYDMLGREVAVMVDDRMAPGTYTINLDASRLASGIYIYRLEAGSFTQTRKMTLIK